jgi:hypothetical protein
MRRDKDGTLHGKRGPHGEKFTRERNVGLRLDRHSSKQDVVLPEGVTLPDGWTAEFVPSYQGIVLSARDGSGFLGYMTVSLTKRNFASDMGVVRETGPAERFGVRGWRTALFNDAIAALQAVLK